jgi:hypothetical protein
LRISSFIGEKLLNKWRETLIMAEGKKNREEEEDELGELLRSLGVSKRKHNIYDKLFVMMYILAFETGEVNGFEPEKLLNGNYFVRWVDENDQDVLYSCFSSGGKLLWSQRADKITRQEAKKKCIQS